MGGSTQDRGGGGMVDDDSPGKQSQSVNGVAASHDRTDVVADDVHGSARVNGKPPLDPLHTADLAGANINKASIGSPSKTANETPRRPSLIDSSTAGSFHGHELLVTLLLEAQKQQSTTNNSSELGNNNKRNAAVESNNKRGSISLISAHLESIHPGSNITSPKSATVPSGPSAAHFQWNTFKDPEYLAYLNHLTNCSLEQLRLEPEDLKRQLEGIDAQLADLAFSEHRSFLAANACSKEIRRSLGILENNVAKFAGLVPQLNQTVVACESRLKPIMNERRKSALVLAHYPKLLEILEIPQLLETFIRNGNYEEAMDLQTHVNRLVLRHPNIAVIQQIAAEAAGSTSLMLNQLVALLGGNAKLPLCIRIIGYLRRLEAFPEPELRLVFLQQKNSHFQALLKAIPSSDPADYLKKYIDVSREHFFDIVTQYKAIFSESVSGNSSTSPATAGSFGVIHATSANLFFPDTSALATSTILSSYIEHTFNSFLNIVQEKISLIHDATALNTVMTQTMYYGMSLGRVGVDFRPTISDIFVNAVDRIVRTPISSAIEVFLSNLATSKGVGLYMKSNVSLYGGLTGLAIPTGKAAASGASIVSAPAILLSFPPLAQLMNGFFTSFNQLRVFAPIALYRSLSDFVIESLDRIAGGLESLAEELEVVGGGGRGGDADPPESEVVIGFRETVKVFVEIFAPTAINGFQSHVYGGMSTVFGGASVQSVMEKDFSLTDRSSAIGARLAKFSAVSKPVPVVGVARKVEVVEVEKPFEIEDDA